MTKIELMGKYEGHKDYNKICNIIENALENAPEENENNLSNEFIEGVEIWVLKNDTFDSELF